MRSHVDTPVMVLVVLYQLVDFRYAIIVNKKIYGMQGLKALRLPTLFVNMPEEENIVFFVTVSITEQPGSLRS